MAETVDKKAKKLKDMDAEAGRKGTAKGRAAEIEIPSPEKKRHPVRNTLLLTALSFVALILAVIALCRLGGFDASGEFVYWLDPEGYIRGPILLFLNPEEESREVYYSGEIADVYERDADLDARERELDARETALEAREALLDDREDYLREREDQVNEWIDWIFENNAQGISNSFDITDMAKRVAGMNPKRAAVGLENMDEEQVLQILLTMKPAEASRILDNMDPERVAELIALGLEEEDYDFSYPASRPGAVQTPAPPPTSPSVPEETGPPLDPEETGGPDPTEPGTGEEPNSGTGEPV
ncbi:MAG: hypothetical protein FWG93_03205 [Oscillospiraceae bacterium]|nr:hypothetical protein [Oscillospiraceae bacterium]